MPHKLLKLRRGREWRTSGRSRRRRTTASRGGGGNGGLSERGRFLFFCPNGTGHFPGKWTSALVAEQGIIAVQCPALLAKHFSPLVRPFPIGPRQRDIVSPVVIPYVPMISRFPDPLDLASERGASRIGWLYLEIPFKKPSFSRNGGQGRSSSIPHGSGSRTSGRRGRTAPAAPPAWRPDTSERPWDSGGELAPVPRT